MARTTLFKIRNLDDPAKERIRSMMRHGDLKRIAERCHWLTYRQVQNIIHGHSHNDKVWLEAIDYLNTLEDIEIDERLAEYINGETEAA